MYQYFAMICLVTIITGCASTGRVVNLTDVKASGPKIIALNAPSAPWVLRWSSRSRVTEKTSSTRLEQFNEAEARYVLVVEGFAPYDWANRCFGGGYNFSHISVDLVDTVNNETILNINGSGYSENCPPMSGTIFSDIANAVKMAWE